MIGIYKITNKINGKMYIGQSNNIERRFSEHKTKGAESRIPLDIAIQKYGQDNFLYEIIEECNINELNEKESYWISYYDSIKNGYNCSEGGNQQSIGENNGRSKLTEKDIIFIRKSYDSHKKQKDIYEYFKDKISFNYFQNIWQGKSWSHVMPEVFTQENKEYYMYQNSKGSDASKSRFTDEEVIALRKRYIKESAKSIWNDGYSDRVSLDSFQKMLRGYTYNNLPIFGKGEKYTFSDNEVLEIRKKYVNTSAKALWEEYRDKIPFGTFKKIIEGKTYTHLPIYKKREKRWINN